MREFYVNIIDSESRINDELISRLKGKFPVVEFEKDEFLFKQGDPDTALYIIVDGKAALTTHHVSYGTSIESGIIDCNPPESLGALSFLGGDSHKASARALSKITAIKVSQDDFIRVRVSSPLIAEDVMVLAIRSLQSMVSSLILKYQDQQIMLRGHKK